MTKTADEISELSVIQEKVATVAHTENPAAALDAMLKNHAIVLVGGSARITSWRQRGLFPGDTCETLELLSEQGFKLFYKNLTYLQQTPNGAKLTPLTAKFFSEATRYTGLIYAPGEPETIDGNYNMWRGFGVKPAPGRWPLMQAHIHDIIAACDDELAKYILDWLAWALQNPGRRAEVALVLRGGKGVGKGAIGATMTRLFGSHGLHISDRKHLTGSFNSHLKHCSFLFADEAFWPGDKAGEGQLKRLLTESTLIIEPKGVDLFTVRNCLHVMVAGNSDWLVPASGDERRFAVIDVSGARAGDDVYFRELYAELDNSGLAAMLHDLLERDLAGWHPRDDVPQTRGLQQQKVRSLGGIDALVRAVAVDGRLPYSKYSMPNVSITSGEHNREGFWHFAKVTISDLRHRSSHNMMPELRSEWGCKRWSSGGTSYIRFIPLPEIRQRFEAKHGPQAWNDTGEAGALSDDWEPSDQ